MRDSVRTHQALSLRKVLNSSEIKSASFAFPVVKFPVPGLRWWIAGLVFLATLINFIDRLTISILGPVIIKQFSLTNLQFAKLTTWFLVAYTLSRSEEHTSE